MTLRQWIYRKIYLKSHYWQRVRKIVSRRAGFECQVEGCDKTGHNLDTHHTTYKILWLEWIFPNKMVYLCRRHHEQTHAGKWLRLKKIHKQLPPFGYKQ